MNRPLVIWRFIDDKAGHASQSRGLVAALASLREVVVHDLPVPPGWRAGLYWITGRWPPKPVLPDPDLILGAGHATHGAMLAARRARGGKIVVLMQPSLPLAWFDLCLIPEHDQPPDSTKVVITRGGLNSVQPTGDHRPDRGLLLIGGPSHHYGWESRAIAAMVNTILQRETGVTWHLTNSRRTPGDFLPILAATCPQANLAITPHQQTKPEWVSERLAESGLVWVTEDSVSMVYEAITSGAAVGLLPVPQLGDNRIGRGLQARFVDGSLTPYAAWLTGKPLIPAATPLNEAARCAQEILLRWPNLAP